jgi:hypothetical protein
MGEDAEDEDEDYDEDDDGKGDAATPPTAAPSPILTPPATTHEVIVIKDEVPMEMVPEQEGHVAHEFILADAEPGLPQPRLYHLLMRDYLENPSRMMEDPPELDDSTKADYDADKLYPEVGSNDRD